MSRRDGRVYKSYRHVRSSKEFEKEFGCLKRAWEEH